MILSALIALLLALQQSTTAAYVGPVQVGNVVLKLQCGESDGIRFTLANAGSSDTTLLIGAVLGNGAKYMINNLKLTVQPPGQPAEVYPYSPYDYPGVIVGRLDEWLQALPARAEFSVTAKPDDFLGLRFQRVFKKGSKLRLMLTVPAGRPPAFMLNFWAGTLTSNTCVVN